MNKEQLAELLGRKEPVRLITVGDLRDQSNRTLLYGYTVERDTFHVYLRDQKFHTYVYSPRYAEKPPYDDAMYYAFLPSVDVDGEYVVPNKRLYPAACDFEYCSLLLSRGVHLPFTTFEERPPAQYYGKVFGELAHGVE